MAGRAEARVYTSIWRDEDFLALSPTGQRLYLFLLSQDDLTYCGVLPLRERRWAATAEGLTVDAIERDLKELEAGQFVVTDLITGDLLVRSFMRNDELWKQPNLMKAARSAAAIVRSRSIRVAMLAELLRVPAQESSSRLVREVHAAFVEDLGGVADQNDAPEASRKGSPEASPEASRKGSPEASPKPSRNPSPKPSQERGVRNGSSERTLLDSLTPELRSGANAPVAPSATPATELTITQRSKRITDAYAAAEPMCKWPAVNGVVIKAIKSERFTDDEIHAAVMRLAKEGRGVTVETLRVELSGFTPSQPAPKPAHPLDDAASRSPAHGTPFKEAMHRALHPEDP